MTNYENLSTRKLMRIAEEYGRLSAVDQEAIRQEFASRGLDAPMIEDPEDAEEHLLPVEEAVEMVTVARYRDMPEAIVARAVLEGAGIPCLLRDENTVHMDWMMSNFIGGMRLQVEAEDEADARAILSQPMPEHFAVDSGADYFQPVCPRCNSLDVMANDTDRKLKLSSTMLSGLPMIVCLPVLGYQRDDVWKCLNCGCRWLYDDAAEPSAQTTSSGQIL